MNSKKKILDIENQFRTSLSQNGILNPKSLDLYYKFTNALLPEFLKTFDPQIESKIWKIAHYKLIEGFRQEIKANAGNKESIKLYTVYYKQFLTIAFGFYLDFIVGLDQLGIVPQFVLNELGMVMGMPNQKTVQIEDQMKDKELELKYVLSRCLVYLGDLARYQIQLTKKKEFGVAKKYYNLSLQITPDVGNAYNQLAVLAHLEGFQDFELLSLDYYLRSLNADTPFPTAIENLTGLLKRERKQGFIGDFVNLFLSLQDSSTFKRESDCWIQELEKNIADLSPNTIIYIFTSLIGLVQALKNDVLQPLLEFEKSRYEYLSIFLLNISKIIVDRTISLIDEDYEVSQNNEYENYLILLKLIIKVCETDWYLEFKSSNESIQVRKSVAIGASLVAKLFFTRFSNSQHQNNPPLMEEDLAFLGCKFLDTQYDYNQYGVFYEKNEIIKIRINQILAWTKALCQRREPLYFERTEQPYSSFSIYRLDFSMDKPRSPLYALNRIESALPSPVQKNIMPGMILDENDELNTLSFLGLSSIPPTADYILPSSSVKKVSNSKLPSPIGPKHTSKSLAGTNIFNESKSKDPFFSKLSAYQQSMVSPIWHDVGDSFDWKLK